MENDFYDAFLNDDEYNIEQFNLEIDELNEINILIDQIKEEVSLKNPGVITLEAIKGKIFKSDLEFYFISSGIIKKEFDFDKLYKNTFDDFENSKVENEERLFHLKRKLSYLVFSNSLGFKKIPYRLFGVGNIVDNKLKIKKSIISYPYRMILEDKSENDIKL